MVLRPGLAAWRSRRGDAQLAFAELVELVELAELVELVELAEFAEVRRLGLSEQASSPP